MNYYHIETEDIGVFGEDHNISVFHNGEPFSEGVVVIETPGGKEFTREADEEGRVMLPLESKGSYSVSLLSDGRVVDQVNIASELVGGDGPDKDFFSFLDDVAKIIPFILLILAIVGILIILYKRYGKERFTPTKRESKKE